MKNEEIFLSCVIISLIIFIIWIYRTYEKDKKAYLESIELNNKCTDYLETCRKRANLSTSTYALELLWKEMNKSADTYKYNQTNYIKFQKIKSYMSGKYAGLLKLSQTI